MKQRTLLSQLAEKHWRNPFGKDAAGVCFLIGTKSVVGKVLIPEKSRQAIRDRLPDLHRVLAQSVGTAAAARHSSD